MFYSQFILAKKGPLGTIWIAAHLERKLRKNQVADTDIGVSVDSILFPDVPIALRLSSHLLLGVVRIYSRKVNYLFDDCSEALLKVKQAFRSAAVDLPPEQSKAPYHSITLPETFDLDDFEIPDNEVFQGNFVDHHVSTREQITLQDTMDGVAFPTSQFGPDERFGDGDASQIGLDLDEELFLDKGEAAGTSSILMDTDVDPQASSKASSPPIGDKNNEGISDPLVASPATYFSIQAPSTPGLMEEPELASAPEAPFSDDHMDEDHNPSELAAKEVSGSLSLSELETEKSRSPGVEHSAEAMEHISSGTAQLDISNEYVEAGSGSDHVGNILNGNCIDHEKKLAADDQTIRPCEDEGSLNGIASPLFDSASVMDMHSSDPCNVSAKTDLNGSCLLFSDNKIENDISSAGLEIPGTGESDIVIVSTGVEAENAVQSCLDANALEASNCDIDEGLSVPSMPVLQSCKTHIHHACNDVSSLVGASDLPAEDDGHCLLETSNREDVTTIVSGVSVEVEDNGNINGKVDNMITHEDNFENDPGSNISDLPVPEKLRSMPDLPVEQSIDFHVECTPGKEDLAEGNGDTTMEKIISGRKRSYTESTLTIQSLNSAESSGATQSKRSAEFVPEDDDLLSSILAGRKSTALKLKPTPPVTQPLPSKRQRVAVRSSAHKRKVLVDDATVLHGDTIRQQLTDTEDIRRVRKKAPCTCQEIWTLQKQILEDEIFSEPIFTGMSPDFLYLHSEIFNLSRIIIIQDDRSKEANEADTSARPTLGEETEHMGSPPSVPGGDQQWGESLVENSGQQESAIPVDEDILLRVTKTEENEVREEAPEDHAADKRVEKEIGDGRVPFVGEVLGTEQACLLGPISEVNCDTRDDKAIGSPSLDKTDDTDVPGNNDASSLLLDQLGDMQTTRDDTSTLEGICGAEMMDQEGAHVTMSERLDSDERLHGKHSSRNIEVVTTVVREDTQDPSSSPLHDVNVIQSMPLEDGACPTSDQFMGENQLNEAGISKMDEISDFDLRHDVSSLNPIYHVGDELKLDSSCSTETDIRSGNTMIAEGENLEYCEADPKNFMDSTPVYNDFVYAGSHADFGTDVIEHDTDFLNVDDDDVAEDFEGDMPSTEEKRIVDNSGWSARTRAVANYLQVLFEKEDHHGKEVVSLENLLAGKSRKEASRMFFETLVLKTKDYIHAEQEKSFCDIRLKPRGKLLKSDY